VADPPIGEEDFTFEGLNKYLLPLAMLLSMSLATIAYSQGSPLTVEIQPAQSTVKNDQDFLVATTIRNVGRDEQSLQIWSCSYPTQWKADKPSVHLRQVPCKKNSLEHVILKPGEAYERTLSIRVGAANKDEQESIAFRLGFEPAGDAASSVSLIWSNSVTVNVTD